ncbi:nucleoside kinase [Bacillota bacterium LX-D]|nr:nucleoside kinase [Bacillota bacterium LX-D]
MKKIKITYPDGTVQEIDKGTTLLKLCQEENNSGQPYLAARVNNVLKDLHFSLQEDAKLEFLDLTSDDGMRIYQRSLCFLLIKAVGELFPEAKVSVEHSISKGLYCELHQAEPITEKDVQQIENRMRELVAQDIPFVKETVSLSEAIKLFEKEGQYDKVSLLKHRNRPHTNLYSCGWLRDYFYGYMAPSTGYLKVFELKFYMPGFILRFPEKSNPTVVPEYVEQPKLFNIFREAEKWAGILEIKNVGSLNEQIASGNAGDLIRVSEAFHEKKIAEIADLITKNRDQIRLILIAGPSSSGKTTFAQRLAVQLRVNDVRPISISLDDYFVSRDKTPLDELGEPDFEALEAIELDLFNEHLTKLIQGSEVELPVFDFITGQREYKGRRVKIKRDQPIIIEGIHGLNDQLTTAIPRGSKFKIYISALTQLNIDDHNRISTTDARIIRRIVRDNQFRSNDALKTIRIWPKVRKGEERNIFPFQENADVMFNSHLVYELAVLVKYAAPLLQKIDEQCPEYSEAKRLLKFLGYFLPMDDKEVPFNSIIREFIGNSCFC